MSWSTEYPNFTAVGGNLLEFQPTCELRWRLSPTPGEKPTLQQKWVASKTDGDITYSDSHWRDVPNFEDPI